ncbi:MAG: sigma-70 family RNA polymerase sigma factor [Bacteroidota bacterium]
MAGKSSFDQEIIRDLQLGGVVRERAEYKLYRAYMYFVRERPRKYRLSDEEAQDAYTEAFLAVTDHVVTGRFRGESLLKTYLSRIFRNKCVDQHRKNTTRKVNWVDEFPELPDDSRDFMRQLIGKEDLEKIRRQMEQLGDRCRELLWLAAQAFSPGEIAERMGFKTSRSASSQRYKCLERLKTLISKEKQP